MNAIAKKTGYCTSFDGTRIYYEVRGEGPPIVMVYGIGCLMNHWRFQSKYFAQHYTTVVFDYRGHHKSDTPRDLQSMGVSDIAKDIASLLKHLQIPQASFWGHSFGVQVLLRTYDLYPELFANLVFVNGFASDPVAGMFGNGLATKLFSTVKKGLQFLPETSTYLWGNVVQNPLSVFLSGLAGGFNLHLTQLKDIEIYARGIASLDLKMFTQLFEGMMAYDGRPVFEKINVPTLVLSGSQDSVTPKKHQEEMHEKIQGSTFVNIPYGSHCTQLDMPDYVNLTIEKFLHSVEYGKEAIAPEISGI